MNERDEIKAGYKLDRWQKRSELVSEIEETVKAVAEEFNSGKMNAQLGNKMLRLGTTLIKWDERTAKRAKEEEEKLNDKHNPEGIAKRLKDAGYVGEARVWQNYGKTRIYFGDKDGYIELNKDGKWEPSKRVPTCVWEACLTEKEYVSHVKSIAYAHASGKGLTKEYDESKVEIPERPVVLNK